MTEMQYDFSNKQTLTILGVSDKAKCLHIEAGIDTLMQVKCMTVSVIAAMILLEALIWWTIHFIKRIQIPLNILNT